MNARLALPGCSLLLWGLIFFIGLSLRTFSPEQAFHYRWLPGLMALGSLTLIFLTRTKYGNVAAQACAAVLIIFFAGFLLSYTGGI